MQDEEFKVLKVNIVNFFNSQFDFKSFLEKDYMLLSTQNLANLCLYTGIYINVVEKISELCLFFCFFHLYE